MKTALITGITGQDGAEVQLTFTNLPANLTSGANSLPIVYGADAAAYHTSDAPGSGTSFNPAAGATTNLDAATGQLYVWIGGEVQPPETQPAGNYTATITLNVSYTGN